MFFLISIHVFANRLVQTEVRNSWDTKSSHETELPKMTSHFELLTQKCFYKFFFRVTNSDL